MEYTKYEKARIIGARALQLAMGAPLLIKNTSANIDTVQMAGIEFKKGVLPITVKRPKPVKLNIKI
jgi:DNA-directed RNA polymerase subunit K